MTRNKKKIVMMACDGPSTNAIYNYLKDEFDIVAVIKEEKSFSEAITDKYKFINRRVKKLGIWRVIGQLLFVCFISRYLTKKSGSRMKEIVEDSKLDVSPIPKEKIVGVKSINAGTSIKTLNDINPDAVVVNGTRIISEKVINTVNCKMFNIHAGITPKYRGVHGMYWALVNNDLENCGVTVHFIDKGIDTGNILFQERVTPTEKDNFTTYFYLQFTKAIPKLKQALVEYFDGTLKTISGPAESKLYTHPTIWEYWKNDVK